MDLGAVLVDLLVILIAARLAAEIAERLGQPAVLAEILVGALIGPAVLGVVGGGEILDFLAELGVILLLFEVGREMDLAEFRRVGAASFRVAAIGVVVPFAAAFVAMRALGFGTTVALFVSGGVTATSVGITARVFGDLRALASPEARTVLGAAVVDDVLGLLVLTVVVRAATGAGVDPGSVGVIVLVAVGFVVGAVAIGSWIVPRLLDRVERGARTDGTVMAAGLVLALAFARLASAARLAPIVGAFVAGLVVGRSNAAEELHRRLTPLGHFLIPIFFLRIGIDADPAVFAKPDVLGAAALISMIAVAGKLVAGWGASKGSADRVLVGIGMIPRGEVGLIFASLGRASGVLDARAYGILVAVVLVSTLAAPPWIRARLKRTHARAFQRHAAVVEPAGGWLRTGDGEVELAAEPPPALVWQVAIDAAIACARARPGPELSRWVSAAAGGEPIWDDALRARFLRLLADGNDRSWRFLEVTGVFPALLPDVAAALRRRTRDPFDLDPSSEIRFDTLASLNAIVATDKEVARAWSLVPWPQLVRLAALVGDAWDGGAPQAASTLATTLGLEPDEAAILQRLTTDSPLPRAAARRPGSLEEESILEIATHIGGRAEEAALYALAVARGGLEVWERERLDTLHGLVERALEEVEVTGPASRDLVERRLAEVSSLLARVPHRDLRQLLAAAPRRYLLTQSPEVIARHVRMIEILPTRFEARLIADPGDTFESWTVHVALLDRPGALAAIAGAFTSSGVSVSDAAIATWRNGVAVDVFRVLAPAGIDLEGVRLAIEGQLVVSSRPGSIEPVPGEVEVDNVASPWQSVVEIRAGDRVGLLHRVASAMARVGIEIHHATLATRDGVAIDTFWVTGPSGGKLTERDERALRASFAGGAPARRRRWRRRAEVPAPLG